MSVRLETARKIVYIEEFDKHDIDGSLLCRNIDCKNYPRSPYRKYCSKKCNKDFRRWYYHNFYWERVRSDIFKRDNYTCQICNRSYPYRYQRSFPRSKKLECDHIIPRSLYEQNGYKFDTLENKIKATIEFFLNYFSTMPLDVHSVCSGSVNKFRTIKKAQNPSMMIVSCYSI